MVGRLRRRAFGGNFPFSDPFSIILIFEHFHAENENESENENKLLAQAVEKAWM